MKTQTCSIDVDRGQPDILTWLLNHPWVDADMLGEITFEVVYEGVEVRMAAPLSWCLDRPEEVARLVCRNMWVKDFEAGMKFMSRRYTRTV